MKFGVRKPESWGYQAVKKIMTLAFFVLTQYRRVTDGRTDGHVAVAITRASTVNGVTVTVYSSNEGDGRN